MEINPHYLVTFPTNLAALLRLSEHRKCRPSRLKQVGTMSEVLDPEVREACRSIWGVPLVDTYSSREFGPIALQCPEYPHYHVQSENVLVEVLDEQGDPCPPGGVGRLVITALHNFAMPLIRYELGDYAEVGEPCPCGRGLPVLKRILGRSRNMLTLPSGEKIWPWVPGYQGFLEVVRQFQIIQHSLEEIEVKLVTDRPLTAAEEEDFRSVLTDCLRHPFRFRFERADAIPRSAGGKYEDFVSLIDA